VPKNVQRLTPGPPTRVEPAIDEVDRHLLSLLSRNARMANNALAEAVGIAPSTCLTRVRSLRDRGVIRGFHIDVDLEALGLPIQALVAVRLSAHSRDDIERFQAHLQTLPFVLGTFHVSGTNDYLLHVAAASSNALRDFVVDRVATHSGVMHAETSLIFGYLRGATDLLLGADAD
jgi:DNA-binding Lrp family transcriptional regulator